MTRDMWFLLKSEIFIALKMMLYDKLNVIYFEVWSSHCTEDLCMISGFGHEVDENFTLPGYYATGSGNSISVKMGLIGFLESSVRNYQYSLCNNPEEHSSQVMI
jgi:hypothetical protein